MVRCFFSLIHFLVVKDYELPKSIKSYILSVTLNLECVRIPSWSISFFSYFSCLPDNVLCKFAIWADNNTLNSSCDQPSDLLQQVVIWSWKYENAIPKISGNAILHPIIYWYLGKVLTKKRNDLKQPETTYKKQEKTWNDLQRTRNNLKQPKTSSKWIKMTHDK